MFVYRIENYSGVGPYMYFGHQVHEDLRRALYNVKHIDPVIDGIPRCILKRFPHFAFKHHGQLEQWFRDALPYLKGFYYCIYEIENDEFFEGQSQLVFDRNESKLIFRSPIQ